MTGLWAFVCAFGVAGGSLSDRFVAPEIKVVSDVEALPDVEVAAAVTGAEPGRHSKPPDFECRVNTSEVDSDYGSVLGIEVTGAPEEGQFLCKLSLAWDGWIIGDKEGDAASTSPSFLAKVVSAGNSKKSITCSLPPLQWAAEGPVVLQVSTNSSHGVLTSNKIALWYSTRLTASFSQTPYYNTLEGELLLRTNVSAPQDELRVRVAVPDLSAGSEPVLLLQAVIKPNTRAAIPVSFKALNVTSFSGTVVVSLYDGPKHLLDRPVQLALVPGTQVGMSAVDHKRRSLMVDSKPFYPIGWFSMNLHYGVEVTLEGMRLMSSRGANSMMLYNLFIDPHGYFRDRGIPPKDLTPIFDAAQALGLKVHVYVRDLVSPLASGKSTNYTILDNAVTAWRDHPAVLSWYVGDDGTGPKLPEVYEHIKKLDPYHIISMAIAGAGDAASTRYLLGTDVIMVEDYPYDPESAFAVINVMRRWPLEYSPAVSCAKAWNLPRAVFMSQFFTSLIAGMTGESWFAWRNQPGWYEPGVPLADEAFKGAQMLLDLIPSLLADSFKVDPLNLSVTAFNVTEEEKPGAVRAKAFPDETGCVTVLVASKVNEPTRIKLQFGFGARGIYDDNALNTIALVPFELATPRRKVQVVAGAWQDFLPSLGFQAYRLNHTGAGCAAALGEGVQEDNNLIANPSFEESGIYLSQPYQWGCGMNQNTTTGGSNCFTDSHYHVLGRKSGRFVTGMRLDQFQVTPSISWHTDLPEVGKYRFKVHAMSNVLMTLLVETTGNFTQPETDPHLMHANLTTEWQELEWEVEMNRTQCAHDRTSHGLKLQSATPGVLWLDAVSLQLVTEVGTFV